MAIRSWSTVLILAMAVAAAPWPLREARGVVVCQGKKKITLRATACKRKETTLEDDTIHAVGQLDSRVGQLEGGVTRLDGGLSLLDGRVGQVDSRLGQLDNRVGRLEGLAPKQPRDVVAVQASQALSSRPLDMCVRFDRLATPPTVTDFTIPEGKVFVLTSVDWIAAVPSRASKSLVAEIFIVVADSVNGASATGVAMADSDGIAGGTITIPTGLVIEGNQQPCITVALNPFSSNDSAPADGVAHGFFADAQ